MTLSAQVLAEASKDTADFFSLQACVGGWNTADAEAKMPLKDAVLLENWFAYPDRVEMRYGAANHVLGFTAPVKGLWDYNGPVGSRLFATTSGGIYDVTSPGIVGAAVIALTNGETVATQINTGATAYLLVVNGVDTLKQYDGAAWTSVAAFGALATSDVLAIETYRQRIYLLQKATLTFWFLPVNSVSGAATSFNLGALFRKGGSLVAVATWTIDGGSGPDDHIAFASSAGEVVVFAGTDPAVPANWVLRGVYFIGRPLGRLSLYKFGGDLLYLCEGGLYPLSRALQTASIDRTHTVSWKIRQAFAAFATQYGSLHGWQLISHPDIPLLLVNVPGTPAGQQLAMHPQTGAWASFTNWNANCWARVGQDLYYGTTDRVVHAWVGSSDQGVNIVATMLQAYNPFKYKYNKKVELLRPMLTANGPFSYTVGVANDFDQLPTMNLIVGSAGSAALWGTAIWGAALWGSSQARTRDWRGVPDKDGIFKALYLQVSSIQARVSIANTDVLFTKSLIF